MESLVPGALTTEVNQVQYLPLHSSLPGDHTQSRIVPWRVEGESKGREAPPKRGTECWGLLLPQAVSPETFNNRIPSDRIVLCNLS